jgi:hypothetical protein
MVFQKSNPFPKSIFENVVYGLRVHGSPSRKRLEEVAERAETLSYEILCSMGKRVVRVFLRDGKPAKILTLIGERQESEAGPGTRRARVAGVRFFRIHSGMLVRSSLVSCGVFRPIDNQHHQPSGQRIHAEECRQTPHDAA